MKQFFKKVGRRIRDFFVFILEAKVENLDESMELFLGKL